MARLPLETIRVYDGPQDVTPRATSSGGGRVTTVSVAATNSYASDVALADFVCTGTNDHEVIQQALDAVRYTPPADGPPSGAPGRVVLLAGTYEISEMLVMYEGVTLIGMGASSIVRPAFSSDAFYMVYVEDDCTIRDISFWGVGNPGSGPTRHAALYLGSNRDHVNIESCHFRDLGGAGIVLNGGDYRIITDCHFRSCGILDDASTPIDYANPDGSYASPFMTGITATWGGGIVGTPVYDIISNCKFLFCEYDGIFADGGVYFTVSGCEFSDSVYSSNGAGITLRGGSGVAITGNHGNMSGGSLVNIRNYVYSRADYISVVGNSCSAGYGDWWGGENFGVVSLIAPDDTKKIENCVISGNTLQGPIVLDGPGVVNNLIDGNMISGKITDPDGDAGAAGILVDNGASMNTIINNKCLPRFSQTYGVWIKESTSTDNWVAMNDVRGMTVAGVQNDGTGTDTTPYNKV